MPRSLSVRKSLWLSFATVLGVAMAAAIAGVVGLLTLEQTIEETIDRSEPLTSAAYEMEINTIGAGLGVLTYLLGQEQAGYSRFVEDRDEFYGFLADFERLAAGTANAPLATRMAMLYDEFELLGRELI